MGERLGSHPSAQHFSSTEDAYDRRFLFPYKDETAAGLYGRKEVYLITLIFAKEIKHHC